MSTTIEVKDGQPVYVWGVQEKPFTVKGAPEGSRVRVRVRSTEFARAYVRRDGNTQEYLLQKTEDPAVLFLGPCTAQNLTVMGKSAALPGQTLRRLAL